MRERFREYKRLLEEIDYLEDRLLEVETRATSMSPVMSDMPKGNYREPDKITDLVAAMIEYKSKINAKLKKAYEYKADVEEKLNLLPSGDQHVMRLRYIDGKSLEYIAVELNYSFTTVKRIHKRSWIRIENMTK